MNFIDHTGHIFTLEDYISYPVGFEYDDAPYVFWLSDEYASNLSVDCFYIKPIRLICEGEIQNIKIELQNTRNYKLISPSTIQNCFRGRTEKNLFETIELSFISDEAKRYIDEYNETHDDYLISPSDDLVMELNTDDILNFDGSHRNYVYIDKYYCVDDKGRSIIIDDVSQVQGGEIGEEDVRDMLNTLDFQTKEFMYTEYSSSTPNYDPFTLTFELSLKEKRDLYTQYCELKGEEPQPLDEYELIDAIVEFDTDFIQNFIIDRLLANCKDIFSRPYTYTDKSGETHDVFLSSTKMSMITFYVAGTASEEGTWLTNALISLETNKTNMLYCPITIGGTFVDEVEALVVNGKNMGVSLPKDICKALYHTSFWNEVPNQALWNQKLKEYLLNYMKLRGERGNFQSALSALKWFGYGNKIEISSLMQTDNEFLEQYVLNNFDIHFDIINEYRHFRNATLISLKIPQIIEDTSETNSFDFNSDFWGEAKPKTKNLFEQIESRYYDEKDIEFIRSFYDWDFNEMGLKLSALAYYYQKYFLPIHLNVHRASITAQCFAPDIKLLSNARTLITEKAIYVKDDSFTVKFPDTHKIMLSKYCRYIDENWIEDPQLQTIKNEDGIYVLNEELLKSDKYVFFDIKDNCFSVTIRLVHKKNKNDFGKLFYCKLLAYQDNDLFKESNFTIYSTKEEYVLNFIIYPKALNKDFDINFWLDRKYKIVLLCNGVWFEYEFKLEIPELDIELGKLVYSYDEDVCRQFSGYVTDENTLRTRPQFNVNMYMPELVTVNNIDYVADITSMMANDHILHTEYDDVFSDTVYYWYYDENGEKVILSSGKYTLVKVGANYYLKENKYDEEALQQIVSNGPIYSSVYKNIDSLVDLYRIQTSIPRNNDFLNKVHIFNMFEFNEEHNKYQQVKYDPENLGVTALFNSTISKVNEDFSISYENLNFYTNDSQRVVDMYNSFFDERGYWKRKFEYLNVSTGEWYDTDIEKEYYDIYLMHDFDYWYIVMISKRPITNHTDFYSSINKYYKSNDKYLLEYNRSDEKFLVNRMKYKELNGVYHFNTKDMVVAKLNNFDNISFKLKIGSRWNFYKIGIDSKLTDSFESPTNIGLMCCNRDEIMHQPGYYEVEVSYSIDNFVNHEQKRKTKLLIDKNVEPQKSIEYKVHELNKDYVKDTNGVTNNAIYIPEINLPTEIPILPEFVEGDIKDINCFAKPTEYSEEYKPTAHVCVYQKGSKVKFFEEKSIQEMTNDGTFVYLLENKFSSKFTNVEIISGCYTTIKSITYAYGWNKIFTGTTELDKFNLAWNDPNWEARETDDYIEKRLVVQFSTQVYIYDITTDIYTIIFRQSR